MSRWEAANERTWREAQRAGAKRLARELEELRQGDLFDVSRLAAFREVQRRLERVKRACSKPKR